MEKDCLYLEEVDWNKKKMGSCSLRSMIPGSSRLRISDIRYIHSFIDSLLFDHYVSLFLVLALRFRIIRDLEALFEFTHKMLWTHQVGRRTLLYSLSISFTMLSMYF